jgi:dTDP-4-dehydrorhamnose reductase
MRLLILGKDGQVGRALQSALAPLGVTRACGRVEADLTRPDAVRQVVADFMPAVVINAAAYTAVDQAEADEAAAMAVNGEGPAMLARACRAAGAWLVHYSTDYVFDGQKTVPYLETDPAVPLNVYGRSKWAGEQGITSAGGAHLILRTSWVFDAMGKNFLQTILRLAGEQSELQVIDDQFGAPTWAHRIAQVTALMIYRLVTDAALARQASGIYHVTAAGSTSWHGYARQILIQAHAGGALLNTPLERVYPVSTVQGPMPATRPVNSILDTTKLRQMFGLSLPDWRTDVNRVVDQLRQRRTHAA